MPSTVSWRYDATTRPWLRALFLAGAGVVYGVAVLLAVAAVALLVLALWTGSTGLRLLVVLLALVGGPVSVLYLLPVLRDPDQRPSIHPEPAERVLSTRRKATLGVLGAGVMATAGAVDLRLAAGVAALGALAGLTYALTATRGTVDPTTATLETRAREFDLSRGTGYRTRRVGPVAVVTLSAPARPGRFGSVPTRVRVPADRLPDVTASLDALVAAGDGRRDGRDPNPLVRGIAGGLAALFAGVGVAGVVLVGAGVGWYVAALCWLFAGVFLVVAREG